MNFSLSDSFSRLDDQARENVQDAANSQTHYNPDAQLATRSLRSQDAEVEDNPQTGLLAVLAIVLTAAGVTEGFFSPETVGGAEAGFDPGGELFGTGGQSVSNSSMLANEWVGVGEANPGATSEAWPLEPSSVSNDAPATSGNWSTINNWLRGGSLALGLSNALRGRPAASSAKPSERAGFTPFGGEGLNSAPQNAPVTNSAFDFWPVILLLVGVAVFFLIRRK